MKIYITSAYEDPEPISTFLQLSSFARRHEVSKSASTADAILFVENSHYHSDPFFYRLVHHPLVKAHPDRVFMYNEHDTPWLILPGLYCSMQKRYFNPTLQCSTRYIRLLNPTNVENSGGENVLFSFMGQAKTALRQRIVALKHPRGVTEDTSNFNAFFAGKQQENHKRYADLLGRSKFVICPRGAGTSSIRLFESLRTGRVPIIVSDQWVEPEGPDWPSFSIRVRENDVEGIPRIAERLEPEWQEMSSRAKNTWNEYFADAVFFDRVGDSLQSLIARGATFKDCITVPRIYWRLRMSMHLLASRRYTDLLPR